MLDDSLKTQLASYLERLREPVQLIASLDEREASAEMRELIEEIARVIEWGGDRSTQLLSGFRGTGKSTELTRLRLDLAAQPHVLAVGEQLVVLRLQRTALEQVEPQALAQLRAGDLLVTVTTDTGNAVVSQRHDVAPGLMVLQVPEGHTPDMDGAVSIAQALLPAVNTIYVYAGDILDMTYWQVPNSKAWTALRPAYKPPPKEQ